jgi:cell division protein FtsB
VTVIETQPPAAGSNEPRAKRRLEVGAAVLAVLTAVLTLATAYLALQKEQTTQQRDDAEKTVESVVVNRDELSVDNSLLRGTVTSLEAAIAERDRSTTTTTRTGGSPPSGVTEPLLLHAPVADGENAPWSTSCQMKQASVKGICLGYKGSITEWYRWTIPGPQYRFLEGDVGVQDKCQTGDWTISFFVDEALVGDVKVNALNTTTPIKFPTSANPHTLKLTLAYTGPPASTNLCVAINNFRLSG